MTKEEIDKIIELIRNREIEELLKYIKDEDLKEKILSNPDGVSDIEEKKFINSIYSIIPSEFKDYFDIKCVESNDIDFVCDKKRLEEAQKRYNQYIEKKLNSLNDEQKLEMLKNRNLTLNIKEKIAKSIDNDEIKVEFVKSGEDEFLQEIVAKTIQKDGSKLQILDYIESTIDKANIIATLKSDEEKLKLLELDEFKIISPLNDYRAIIGKSLSDKSKIELINNYKDRDLSLESIIKIADSLEDRELFFDTSVDKEFYILYRQNCTDIDFVKEHFDEFIKREIQGDATISEIKEVVARMFEKNNDVIKNIDFRIVSNKYIDLLGEDKINLISCYPKIQKEILALDDSKLNILCKCINNYVEMNKTDEWTLITDELLNHISKGEYDECISNIEDITQEDIQNLTTIMQDDNWCEITNIDAVRNFNEIRIKKCEDIMQNSESTVEDMKSALFQKIFGHGTGFANTIIEKFGEDIENIDEGEIKDYVKALKEISKIEDKSLLKEIFDNCDYIEHIDKVFIERSLKTEYGKKFNEGLFVPKNELLQENGENIYEAGTEFKMIITALSAFHKGEANNVKSYKQDWNRPAIGCQHFCASYIRNDMIGTAPIKNICYGFSEMKEDSLMLSGPGDVYSSEKGFVSSARRNEKYYTPDEQINNTEKSYNEMDFRRIQDGQKIQPSYIVIFKENEEVYNMEEAKKAQKDWGGIPIVIIDKDKCLESERKKVEDMLEKYSENPTSELAKEIRQKVHNNRITRKKFCEDIEERIPSETQIETDEKLNLEQQLQNDKQISEETIEKIVNKNSLRMNYEKVSAQERKEVTSKIKEIYSKIQQVQMEKEKKNEQR